LEAIRRTLLPSFSLRLDFLMALVAVLGTTISPYLLFWQASEEVEEIETTPGKEPLEKAPQEATAELRRIRIDTVAGMGFSNLVAYFIMLTVAGTLHGPGQVKIETAAQAAEALRPLAGNFAPLLFSLGIVGTGLLAVPILAGSSAYAVSELMNWPEGLQKKPRQAGKFYGVIACGMLIGLALNLLRINPVRALYWSALVNGLVAVPVLIFIMRLASDRQVVGDFILPKGLRILGWITTLCMAAAGVALLFFLIRGGDGGAAS
jgi:Mn2+/Fe2+ NRAMP family transporter